MEKRPEYSHKDRPDYKEAIGHICRDQVLFLRRFACKMLGNHADAEDAVQDVFLKLINNPEHTIRMMEEERNGLLLHALTSSLCSESIIGEEKAKKKQNQVIFLY